MGKGTISLDNFADFHGEVHGVKIVSDLPLEPYIPSSEININLGRIATTARWGRLCGVSFERYSRQEPLPSAAINSLNEDGSTAMVGVSSTRSAGRTNSSRGIIDDSFQISRGVGITKIDFDHDEVRFSLRDPKAWADHLDASIKESLLLCSGSQLSSPPFLRLGWAFLGMAGVTAEAAISGSGEKAGAAYIGLTAAYNFVATMQARQRNQYKEVEQPPYTPELTITPFVSLERLAFVHGYTRTRRFAKTT